MRLEGWPHARYSPAAILRDAPTALFRMRSDIVARERRKNPGSPAMPIHKFTNPPTMAKPPGYTQVVEATTPGRIIYIAGQLGLDLDNKIVGEPGDFRAQAVQTFENLKHALAAAG